MAVLTSAELAQFTVGLQFGGSSPLSEAAAVAVIADFEQEVVNLLDAKGYDGSAIVADTSSPIYGTCRRYVGNKAAAQLLRAYTRGNSDAIDRLDTEAARLFKLIEQQPDLAAGSAAPTAHTGPNRWAAGAMRPLTSAQAGGRSLRQTIYDTGKL